MDVCGIKLVIVLHIYPKLTNLYTLNMLQLFYVSYTSLGLQNVGCNWSNLERMHTSVKCTCFLVPSAQNSLFVTYFENFLSNWYSSTHFWGYIIQWLFSTLFWLFIVAFYSSKASVCDNHINSHFWSISVPRLNLN